MKKHHCFLHIQSIRPHDSNNWHQPTLPSIPLSPKKMLLPFSKPFYLCNPDYSQPKWWIRYSKLGGLFKAMPFTTTTLIIGSLALTGMPFLPGFYCKDPNIETVNMPNTNAWSPPQTATSLTAVCSILTIFFMLLGQPQFSTLNIINKNNPLLIN